MLTGNNCRRSPDNITLGMFPPTKGDAFIDGYSISKNMDKIRECIGVCPQVLLSISFLPDFFKDNILFSSLTAREHLYINAILKGTPQHLVETSIQEMLDLVGLQV